VSELRHQLLGTWAVVRAELGGETMPPEAAVRLEIEFDAGGDKCGSASGDQCVNTGGSYRVRFAGEVSDAGHFELLAGQDRFSSNGANPPHHRITLYGKTGTNAGRNLSGIFQLRGDRLRICLALESDAPPIEFSSNGTANGAPCYLVTYRRKTLRREH